MHRTGSSLISRSLQALGIDLGSNLMPPAQSNNNKGFFEDLDVNSLNEHLLAQLNSSWNALDWFDGHNLSGGQAFAEERKQAAVLLTEKMAKTISFAFKDPRTAILLPFWQTVFAEINVEPHFIITVRNPLDCAYSLAVRDRLHPIVGIYLWARHMIEAVRRTEGRNRLCVSYGRMLEMPVRELDRIATCLGIAQFDPGAPKIAEFCECFLDIDLRHHNYGDDDLRQSALAPSFVIELFDTLQKLAAADPCQQFIADPFRWDEMDSRLRALKPVFMLARHSKDGDVLKSDFDELLRLVNDLDRRAAIRVSQ